MKLFALLLAGVALTASAGDRGMSRGDLLKDRQYRTNSDLTLYVDPTGNDSNACTATGTAACLTIQAAVNKVPRQLRHRVTVNVAAGNFTGFVLNGFVQDQSVQTVTGGLLVQGTLATSTIASGPALGTATSGVATVTTGAYVRGTLTKTGAGWTVDDLRGRFLFRPAGTGSTTIYFPIVGNTADTITVDGAMGAGDGTSTFEIKDATTVINAGVVSSFPVSNTNGSGTGAAIYFVNNRLFGNTTSSSAITVTQMKITAGAVFVSGSTAALNGIQHVSTAGTHFSVNGADSSLNMLRCYSGFTTHAHDGKTHVGTSYGPRVYVASSTFEQGEYTVLSQWGGSVNLAFVGSRFVYRGVTAYYGATVFLNSALMGCDGSGGEWGLGIGETHDGLTGPGFGYVSATTFENCSIMIEQGGGFLDVVGIAGLASQYIINIRGGGTAVFTASGIAATSSVADISCDSGAVTTNFSALNNPVPGGCLSSVAGHSSVCKN